MQDVVAGVADLLVANGRWMAWNTFLALVPWVVAAVVFRPRTHAGVTWWGGALVCVLFLPNAAYVLTDVVHLPRLVRSEPSDWVVVFGILPLFGALFAVGLLAYTDALRRLSTWIVERGWVRRRWMVELAVHAVSAVGIYAGRIHRFNSWDALTQPAAVAGSTLGGFTRPLALAGMTITFCVLALAYLATLPVVRAASRAP